MELQNYVGVKLLKAAPMNRGDYNKYRGWEIPEDENPADEGYLVQYPDTYISWSPKDQFEQHYMQISEKIKIEDDNVQDFIDSYDVVEYGDRTTVVHAHLVNGFIITEDSSCVNPANYDKEIGEEICKKKIEDEIWKLLGFLLQCGVGGIGK